MWRSAMRQRSMQWLCALALTFIASSDAIAAQPPGRTYRIGWLTNSSPPSDSSQSGDELQQALRSSGYGDGTVVIVHRYGNGKVQQLPDLAAELARMPVDIIVTSGEPAALAAKRATNTIPIVATELALDPVKATLVTSLGRPGANVTGMTTQSEELWQKRLALLKQVAPKLSRIMVLWNPTNPSNVACVEEIKAAAPALGMQPNFLEVSDAASLERAFSAIAGEAADALVTCWDSVTLAYAKRIADFALKRRMPTLAPLKEYVEAGALLSLGTSLPAQRRRAAYYVDKILKGAKPADLPVERPTQFDLVVNVTTSKALGLTLPDTLLLLADDVIR